MMNLKQTSAFFWMIALAAPIACSDDEGGGASTGGTGTGSADDGGTAGPAESNCGNGMLDDNEECDGELLNGAACSDAHPAYEGGTLACGGSCTFDASGCTVAADTPLVAINEVTSDSVESGEFAGKNDAIELYNAGTASADLGGWLLSDDSGFPLDKTYTFPAGVTLAPGEFLVLQSDDGTMGADGTGGGVTADGGDTGGGTTSGGTTGDTGGSDTGGTGTTGAGETGGGSDTGPTGTVGGLPFGLNASGEETVSLRNGDGFVSSVVVDGFKARVSYCRVGDGHGAWFQCEQTFGGANEVAPNACGNGIVENEEECDTPDFSGLTCEGMDIGFEGGSLSCTPACNLRTDYCTTNSQIVINEFEASTDDIEIYNGSDEEVDLSGWVLTDGRIDGDYIVGMDDEALVFADGTTLGAGEYLVVPFGVGAGQHPFGLNLGGETVVLTQVSPITIIDQVTYPADSATISYCRIPNGPDGSWTADCAPTMGAEN